MFTVDSYNFFPFNTSCTLGYGVYIGQNEATVSLTPGSTPWSDAIEEWAREKDLFTFGVGARFEWDPTIDRYTQVVPAQTKKNTVIKIKKVNGLEVAKYFFPVEAGII